MTDTPKRIAALDVGSVRIGIAFASEDGLIALPHGCVLALPKALPFQVLADLFKEKGVTLVVVGLPLELDASSGAAVRRTKSFIGKLKKFCPTIKFIAQDERLSSSEAEGTLAFLGSKGSKRKNHVDAMAASIILQAYLDKTRRSFME